MMSIKSVVKTYSLYAALVLLAVTSSGWYITSLKLDTSKETIISKTKEVEAVKANCVAAAAVAKTQNLEEVRKIENENAKKAEVADVQLDAIRREYNANLLQYATKQRVNNTTGQVHLSGKTEITNGSYRSSDSTDIYISFEDAGICAENTARIKAVKAWADTLEETQE